MLKKRQKYFNFFLLIILFKNYIVLNRFENFSKLIDIYLLIIISFCVLTELVLYFLIKIIKNINKY